MSSELSVHGYTIIEMTSSAHDLGGHGRVLVTDQSVVGIELRGTQAGEVRRYLSANNLTGPVIVIPGAERREIHLVTGVSRASLALAALPTLGAIVHADGASIPLPSATPANSGAPRWSVTPREARWVPPVVAIAAAIRATRARPFYTVTVPSSA